MIVILREYAYLQCGQQPGTELAQVTSAQRCEELRGRIFFSGASKIIDRQAVELPRTGRCNVSRDLVETRGYPRFQVRDQGVAHGRTPDEWLERHVCCGIRFCCRITCNDSCPYFDCMAAIG